MHPFFNSAKRVLLLLICALALVLGLCVFVSEIADIPLPQSLLLFAPLYFMTVLFIFPNYYICRGLPLGQSKLTSVLLSQTLALIVTLFLWSVISQIYVLVLESLSQATNWQQIFDDSQFINLALILSQYELMTLAHYLYLALEKSRQLERQALQQQLLIAEADLQSLKATVHPHFLFNALNTLSSLALSEPQKAHRFCLLMAEFLRYSVAYSKKDLSTLAEELVHVQNYLGIERERFGKRLQTQFSIDESLKGSTMPPMILFPLVENAIKHGIDSRIEGGLLSIEVTRLKQSLCICISNPVDELGTKRRGAGYGLRSVSSRLNNRYGEAGLLKKKAAAGQYTVELYLPIELNSS